MRTILRQNDRALVLPLYTSRRLKAELGIVFKLTFTTPHQNTSNKHTSSPPNTPIGNISLTINVDLLID